MVITVMTEQTDVIISTVTDHPGQRVLYMHQLREHRRENQLILKIQSSEAEWGQALIQI
jgi:hypothetical protein